MVSRSGDKSLATLDIYSSNTNNSTQIWSEVTYDREENQARGSESCVCQRLKETATLWDINITATTGCEHCQILFDSIVQFLPAKQAGLSHESWLSAISIQQTERSHMIEVICKDLSSARFSLEIFAVEDEYLGCDVIGAANLVMQPLSADFFHKIQKWAMECNTEHTNCMRTKLSTRTHPLLLPQMSKQGIQQLHNMLPLLPSRILDVGGGQNNKVCLKETNAERAEYVTLSYCWGDAQHLRLTRSTLDRSKEGIAWSMLSKTFQDAITITRGLQIRYIWIDSLCIVQDEPADLKAEIGKMATIYQNSWLTIAATCASNGTKGCFCVPNSEARLRNSKQVRERSTNQQAIYARQLPEGGHDAPDETAIGFSIPKPLMSRGWCYQERLLARRILHICGEEMFWECSTQIECECGRIEETTFKGLFDNVIINEARDDVIVEMWDRILTGYLVRDLTVQEDRLPALTGTSERFGKLRSALGSCVEGHWEGWLLASLLWYVSIDGLFFPAGRNNTHPSWSWASLNGRWSYVRAPVESRFPAKLLSTSWRPQPDPKPLPGRMWIKLEGRLRSARLQYIRDLARGDSVHSFRAQRPQLFDPDTGIELAETWVDTVLDNTTRPFASGTTVYLLQIQEEDIMEIKACRGLILTPADKEMKGYIFERLGVFNGVVEHFENCETSQVVLL